MAEAAAAPDWLAGERRQPTFESMLGAVGGLVALAGVFALFSEVPEDEVRMGGLALALLTLVVGCVLSALCRSRALDAAGVVLAAGSVAPFVFLVLNDPEQVDSEGDFLAAALLAVVVWVVLFALGPARGHGLFLGLSLFGLWSGALGQTEPGALLLPFWFTPGVTVEADVQEVPGIPFDRPELVEPPTFTVPELRSPRTFPTFDTVPPPTFPQPQPSPMPTFRFEPPPTFRPEPPTTDTTAPPEESLGDARLVASSQADDEVELEPIEPFDEPPLAPGVVSVLFGLAYVLGAALLDSARLRRPASAFHLVGVAVLTIGTVLLCPRLGATAAASAGIVFGVAVVALGVLTARRFLAWYAGGALALAVATVVGSIFADSPAAGGICLLVVGAAVVALGMAGGMPAAPSQRQD